MIPPSVVRYLQHHEVPFARRIHPSIVGAQRLAAALHQRGTQVAKPVLLEVDRRRWMAVLPATERVCLALVARALDVREARALDPEEFEDLFLGCEEGAEPPLGHLYGLPVIADDTLADQSRIWMRAGSHDESIAIAWADYVRLESPLIASIGESIDRGRGHPATF
jgi:Ala-tRNA(Pro) deacylase